MADLDESEWVSEWAAAANAKCVGCSLLGCVFALLLCFLVHSWAAAVAVVDAAAAQSQSQFSGTEKKREKKIENESRITVCSIRCVRVTTVAATASDVSTMNALPSPLSSPPTSVEYQPKKWSGKANRIKEKSGKRRKDADKRGREEREKHFTKNTQNTE